MYTLSDELVDRVHRDIVLRGVQMEELQHSLLDHVCCILEREMVTDGDFERLYPGVIARFFTRELKEIEEETVLLLTFKHYYTMKKLMLYSGVFAGVAFLSGSVFKIMHWPGANALLFLGMVTAGLVFLPILFVLRLREQQSAREKLVQGVGIANGILFCFATLFKVEHYPGANILWILTLAMLVFVFIPVWFFTGIRLPGMKLNTVLVTILLVVASGLFFSITGIRKANNQGTVRMSQYVREQQALDRLRKADTARDEGRQRIDRLCEEMKTLVMKSTIEEEAREGLELPEGNTGIIFREGQAGVKLLGELKAAVESYNKQAGSGVTIPTSNSILEEDPEQLTLYSNVTVLNGLTQLQLCLVQPGS